MFRDDDFVQDKIMPLKHVPLLTPRSDEALRRQGLLIEEIMPHFGPAYSIDASQLGGEPFDDESLPREVLAHRIGHQERQRRELIEMLVWERDKIVKDGGGHGDFSGLGSFGGDDSGLSSAALNETKKVEALKRRQKAKMEQAILFEIRSQQAEAQHQATLSEQEARADREKKARDRRKREVENSKRDKEMQRKHQEDQEAYMARLRAAQNYEKEQEMNRLLALKEKARQREQERRNAEIKEKQAQHRREMQEAYERELREQAKRQANMEQEERARVARANEARETRAEQRRMAAQRKREKIQTAFASQERMMNQKRAQFNEKQAKENQRKADWEREKSQNMNRSRMRAEQSAEYIAGVQAKNDAMEQGRKNSILEKDRRATENRERMRRESEYRSMMQREQKKQIRMDKLFHLERSRRIAEYRKELNLQKIRKTDARTLGMERRKSELLAQRRHMRDSNREIRIGMQSSLENFRTRGQFKLPDGMDTSFENPELQTILGDASGGINLSAIASDPNATDNRQRRHSSSAMRPSSREASVAVDEGTSMDDFNQFLKAQM